MSYHLLDFVSEIGQAQSATSAGDTFIRFAQRSEVSIVHAFMGTDHDFFRVTTLPEWAVEADCQFPNLLDASLVKSVRLGMPRIFWGIDIDTDSLMQSETDRNICSERFRLFNQRTAVTFSMPDADGRYRGGGIGLGFEDRGDIFLKRMDEICGVLAVASFAAHSRMQILLSKQVLPSPLSNRQAEILKLLASGFLLGGIADKIGIADSTVNLHLSRLKKKLNVKTKEQALAMALTNKWIIV